MPPTALTLKRHTPLLSWLQDPGSLTTRLQRHSQGTFSVQVLTQHWGRAEPSEAAALGIHPRARVLIREVILQGHGQPWVWARSILPQASLTGSLRCLRKLDNRPLGGWLFKQPGLQRDPLEVTCYAVADDRLPAALVNDQALWGRRSVFYVHGKPLLVGEVFLPAFLQTLE
ncbi:chorismate lyase [Aestuariicella hydrocarbonica]|uniref:Probable chorismate pyruvate-lyase n=1 Tax=Pseudomaricurvus hydrocarbonicus TaxID=1470433 RepID=A0A9E5MPT5_9GAMM|nr:chorismate lyase [Aestuariicella hydrocarbonica]